MSGLIKCPVCGSGMIGSVSRRINKKTGEYKDDFYYRCMSRKKYDGVHFCKYNKTFNQKKVEAEMINLISLCKTNDRKNNYVSELFDNRVDTERMEKERDQLTKELKQVSGAKDKLSEMLDVSDRHYDRKHADMTKRLDDLYDKINDLEQNVEDINICLEEAAARKVSAKNVYAILGKFDKVYDKMTDPEKKKFYRALIQEIEIHDDREKQSDPILKKVHFRIPLAIEGQLGDCVMLSKNSTVETIVLIERVRNAKDFVQIGIDAEEYYKIKDEDK